MVTARIGVLGLFASLAAAPLALAGGGISRPHELKAEAGGEVARATLGSYCVTEERPNGSAGECSEGPYPLTVREMLPVRGGQRVVLRLHDRKVSAVLVTLLRVQGDRIKEFESRLARPVRGQKGHARFRLPAALRGANILDVFLRYEDQMGNADFWVGLEPTE